MELPHTPRVDASCTRSSLGAALFACALLGLAAAFPAAAEGSGSTAAPAPSAAAPAPATALPAPAKGAKNTCASCHSDLAAAKLREPAQLLAKDVHGKANLSCTSCHNGDATAMVAATAHGAGFIAKPKGAEATVAMCGKCHAAPAENYLKGPHNLATGVARKPDCTTCHGAHGVQTASIDLIAEPLCNSCHTIAQARRIHKALGDAEREVTTLDEQLVSMGDTAGRETLKVARTRLRGLAHGLDLLSITRAAAQTLTTVDEVRIKAVPAAGARDWGRLLRTVALVLGGLMLLGGVILIGRFAWAKRHHLPSFGAGELKLIGGVAVVLAIAGTIGGLKAKNYMDHDPKFCTSCHTMGSAFELWEKSGHKNVDCHTCHIPNTVSNLHQLFLYTTQRPDAVVKHAEIDRAICEKCHTGGGNASKFNQVLETPGHKLHVGKQRVECVQCHATSVHRFVPPRDVCASCHKQISLKAAGTMSEMHCLQCHPFMGATQKNNSAGGVAGGAVQVIDAKRSLKPDRAVCLDCHEQRAEKEGVTFPTGKTPMKWDCGKCHKPHEKIKIGSADCFKCHDAIIEGVHKVKAHANCTDCHKPHGWTTEQSTCTNCHKAVNPEKHHADAKKACTECHGAWDN
jgi:hypothetical protein